ncbi:MAG: hypothetical protein DSY66_00240 [Persephonella sp.]|nr:MAG: hypothetical protein DSY53_04585 [Persephonella sp.]RUM62328.1 MAG: hypothetical protein DSY66_00240 [Persephonella sp.]
MKRYIFVLFLILFTLTSCGYKAVDFSERKESGKLKDVYCLEKISISSPEAKLTDTLYRYLSSSIISAGYRLECSKDTTRYLRVYVGSVNTYPIGYSQSLRASVYNVVINVNVKVENRKREILLNKNISETTQFFGTGLRADIERRYAMEKIGRLLALRIFSMISNIHKIEKNGS